MDSPIGVVLSASMRKSVQWEVGMPGGAGTRESHAFDAVALILEALA